MAKTKICYSCQTVGHYPVLCPKLFEIEDPNDPRQKRKNFSKNISMNFKNKTHNFDSDIKPYIPTRDNEVPFLETIFTWNQVFDSIIKYAQSKEEKDK